jgi:hypothetical protein
MKAGDVAAVIGSPPFVSSDKDCPPQMRGWQKAWKGSGDGRLTDALQAAGGQSPGYGTSPGQLGVMSPGSVAAACDLICSSPPFEASVSHHVDDDSLQPREGDVRTSQRTMTHQIGYGSTPGNLGNLPPGVPVDGIVSSPPYAETRIDGNGDEGASGLRADDGSYLRGPDGWERRTAMGARYGQATGNLGNLPAGDIDAVVSSPPYAESINQSNGANDAEAREALLLQPVRRLGEPVGRRPRERPRRGRRCRAARRRLPSRRRRPRGRPP